MLELNDETISVIPEFNRRDRSNRRGGNSDDRRIKSSRREANNRRGENGDAVGDDKRADSERRETNDRRRENGDAGDNRADTDRRDTDDRRGYHAAVKYTSPEALTELRIWLGENCDGDWSIDIADVDVVKSWGNFRVRFDQARDLDTFVSTLAT